MTDMPDNMSSSRTHDQNMSTKRGNIDTSDDALMEELARLLCCEVACEHPHNCCARVDKVRQQIIIAVLRPVIRAEALREAAGVVTAGMTVMQIERAILALIDKERE